MMKAPPNNRMNLTLRAAAYPQSYPYEPRW